MRRTPLRLLTLLLSLAAAAVLVAACGGSSDSTGGDDTSSTATNSTSTGSADTDSGAGVKLGLVAYSVPKPGFDKVIPAFQATDAGKGISFSQSYGASGDQSRKVAAGLKSDLVMFSLEPDMTRLVDANLVDKTWNQDKYKGIASTSVVTIVVRKGNPKNIKGWDDLIRPGIKVVEPNPFSSGSAKWNLIAPWAQYSNGGKDAQAGLDYITKLVSHVTGQPTSGKEATQLFLGGTGDALLTYEDEAIFDERQGNDVEHIELPETLLIENPFAVLAGAPHKAQAEAFHEFVLSPEGQKQWGEAGFRPVDPDVAKQFSDVFYTPKKLWTIAELGGWDKLNTDLFDPDNGSIAKIYDKVTS
jgi:sulfate transport system substrate-binding protein